MLFRSILDGVYAADEARLKSILDETRILSRLVEDLRILSLAESGALQLKREPSDLDSLIRELVTAFGSRVDTKGVSLIFASALASPVVECDPVRIREVLSNLLTNAMRYTPHGGEIRISLKADITQPESFVLVEVADSGDGIAPEDLPHVFDRFYKSGDSGGMGLGLSIAKSLVELHGGKIAASSTSGSGTVISFTLPH